MKILIRHIETLLLEHDCVIVQGLGGFIANPKMAQYQTEDDLFLPPGRAISFNQQLRENDGLLTQSYMQTFDAAYPEALCQLEKDVSQLCLQLDMNGEIQVGSLGTLKKDLSGRVILMAAEADTLSPETYGLAPLHVQPLSKVMHTPSVQPQEEQSGIASAKQPMQPTKQSLSVADVQELPLQPQRPTASRHPFLMDLSIAAAIAAILFILFSAPVIHSTPQTEQDSCIAGPVIAKPSVAPKKVTARVQPSKQASTEESKDVEPTTLQPAATESESPKPYALVLACHVSEKNAQLFIQHLTQAGFKEAEFVKGKVPRILYGRYATEQEAWDSLRRLREKSTDFAAAWVMETKTKGV